jgi:hypothetical protein
MAVKPLTHPAGRTTRPAALTITRRGRLLISHLGHSAGQARPPTGTSKAMPRTGGSARLAGLSRLFDRSHRIVRFAHRLDTNRGA